MTSTLSLLAVLLANQHLVVMSQRAPTADPLMNNVQATCPSTRIEISGYGGSSPVDGKAQVRIDGRSVTGANVAQLIDDLSHKKSVYRLQILCRDGGGIIIAVARGEKPPGSDVRYWLGNAYFSGNELKKYWRPEPTKAENFWFR